MNSLDKKIENVNSIKTLSEEEKEQQRLNDLYDYHLESFDKDDEGLHSICNLAKLICEAKVCNISIIKKQTIFILTDKNEKEMERTNGFCIEAIKQEDMFEVKDATKDERFKNKICPPFRYPYKYYCSFPIKSPQGHNFGSLYIGDTETKYLNNIQILCLKTLAHEVMIELELWKKNINLNTALQKTKRYAKAKSEFFSNLSHEIKTPLNAINGLANELLSYELPEYQKESINIIKSSCEVLVSLVNDVLDFSKIESGMLKITKNPFNLREVMKNLYDLLLKTANEKNLKLVLEIDKKIPQNIIGDKVRIHQIIMNLVGNAIKFTNIGFVILSLNLIQETSKEVVIKFSVRDSGIGIHKNKLSTIFERFEQAEDQTQFKYGGTGLGLSISKNLVELHNSKLNVLSTLHQGSEFYFTIAYQKDDAVEPIKSSEMTDNFTENLKILICEDNLVNIKLFKKLLSSSQFNIKYARDGLEAINSLKQNSDYNFILMDLHMPIVDGYEATQYIRQNLNLDIPIIGYSANFTEEEKSKCLNIGMNDYFQKSFSKNEFFRTFNKIINSSYYQRIKNPIKMLSKKRIFSHKSLSSYNTLKIHNALNKRSYSDKENYTYHSPYLGLDLSNELFNKSISEKPPQSPEKKKEDEQFFNQTSFIEKLNEISDGDKNYEKEFIELFIKEFTENLNNIKEYILVDDLEQLKFDIHKMKSPLSMLGFDTLTSKFDNLIKFYDLGKITLLNKYEEVKEGSLNYIRHLNNYLDGLKTHPAS